VEILSPYTSVKDQREKLSLYERIGVKEYWIVDPANNVVWVYRLQEGSGLRSEHSPTEVAGVRGTYGKPEVYGPEDTLKSQVLEGFSLELSSIFSI